ncbi:unnamed protein product [Malus baccata var. baccata]
MLWMKPLMNILLLSHHSREKLLQIIAAWKVVPECMIIWDDLTVLYAILNDNLMNYYNLHNVHSPLFIFNLSMFPKSGGQVYMHEVYVPFDSLVICVVLGLEPSSAVDMYNFNLITCHYDMKTYHREAYLDTSIPLNWFDFLWRNILGSSNNGNSTLESAKVLHGMLSQSYQSFLVSNKEALQFTCLIILLCQCVGVPSRLVDIYPWSTKDLDKGLIDLSNVMYAIAHGDPYPPYPPNPFLSIINELPSFLLEPSMRPLKFIPQRHMAPSFASYFFAATSGHSGAIAAKWLPSILPRVR